MHIGFICSKRFWMFEFGRLTFAIAHSGYLHFRRAQSRRIDTPAVVLGRRSIERLEPKPVSRKARLGPAARLNFARQPQWRSFAEGREVCATILHDRVAIMRSRLLHRPSDYFIGMCRSRKAKEAAGATARARIEPRDRLHAPRAHVKP
jgi:hypothetical protein